MKRYELENDSKSRNGKMCLKQMNVSMAQTWDTSTLVSIACTFAVDHEVETRKSDDYK